MNKPRHNMATDAIIEYRTHAKDGVIVIERLYAPLGFAFPGGHWEPGLTFAENTVKEVDEEVSLRFEVYNPEKPFLALSAVDRDPRCHMGTVVYIGRGYGTPKAKSDAKRVHHVTLGELERMVDDGKFVFDHAKIARAYLEHKGYGL